jgi:hypothetical protein
MPAGVKNAKDIGIKSLDWSTIFAKQLEIQKNGELSRNRESNQSVLLTSRPEVDQFVRGEVRNSVATTW